MERQPNMTNVKLKPSAMERLGSTTEQQTKLECLATANRWPPSAGSPFDAKKIVADAKILYDFVVSNTAEK
jgi:hypothetical protein